MLSSETISILTKIFKLAIEIEIKTEKIRKKLYHRPLFNLYDAFNTLDINEIGIITIDDLKTFLENHGIFATNKDLICLIERYEKENKRGISYSDFIKEMTPKSARIY